MKNLVMYTYEDFNMLRKLKDTDIECYYLNDSFIRKFLKKVNSRFLKLYFGEWKKKIKKYDNVILFDNGCNKKVIEYIKRENQKCKIIYWLWNKVEKRQEEFLSNNYIDEIWTYNEADAQKYKLKTNTQFFNKNIKLPSSLIKYDVLFCGFDKGRKEKINQFENILNEKNINSNIIIKNKEDKKIKYSEYLNLVSESKCLLDIVRRWY